MEICFIWDKKREIYFIQNAEPFFYAFTDERMAEQFCNSHPGTAIEKQEIEGKADDAYMLACLYQKGYQGGFIDGVFRSTIMLHPKLAQIIPEQKASLSLALYQDSKDRKYLEHLRVYLFAVVTDDGYLAFANTNGSLFAFTDTEHMNKELTAQLYELGYAAIRYYMDNKHTYLINAGAAMQTVIVPES